MAETLVSPGVLARENDQSFITEQPVQAGAAIVGPTVKGPIEVPTIVTSYSDYQNRFGTTFESGSNEYSFFTSIAAQNYFSNGGNTLLVTRVVSGSAATDWDYAEASIPSISTVGNNVATGSADLSLSTGFGTATDDEFKFTHSGTTYRFVTADPVGGLPSDQAPLYFLSTGSTSTAYVGFLETKIDAVLSSVINANDEGSGVLAITSSVAGTGFNGVVFQTGSASSFSTAFTAGGGTNTTTTTTSFKLESLYKGAEFTNSGSTNELSNGALVSGSKDNFRWEITTANTSSGTFSLIIRRGDDNTNTKSVLETFTNLSLDPKQSNYVARVIGDQTLNYNSTENYIEYSGSYPNASRYVRVKEVSNTPDYLDNSGTAKNEFTGSIPTIGSGSYGGAFDGGAGTNIPSGRAMKMYSAISSTDSQGLIGSDYNNMLSLLSNQDEYRYNLLLLPGLTNSDHTAQITTAISNAESRGDNLVVVDPVNYGSTLVNATSQAAGRDTSYAAMYWPWITTLDPDTGDQVKVPASTLMGGVFAFNDNAGEPWFAPAGINRGGMGTVIRAERKLSQSNRDSLYEGNVNPIATFPGTGVVVYGQKTLQKQASALDRVNVRRLLIELKSYISQVSQTLVFEQNTAATRNNFLSQVNPYLESVQQRQGLYAFRVVMDDTNNTADVIDRNQLVGQIFIQPTRTAEFIYLDFNVLPTGATFPS
jgi:hypothetical protein